MTNGLITHLKFDDATSPVAIDSADTNDPAQNGTFRGGMSRVGGYFGGGVQFNGVSQHIELTGYKGILGTSSRSVTVWINTTVGGAVTHWGAGATGARWTLRVGDELGGGNGALRLEVGGGQIVGTTDLRDGQWHLVAVVYDSSDAADVENVKLYIDGDIEQIDAIASQSHAFNTIAGLDVRIGHSHYGKRFKGVIDDYRLYDRALTQAEIQSMSPTKPNTAPTVNDAEFGIFDDGEIGAVLGTVIAGDVDATDTLTYSIVDGNDGGVFDINPSNGQVTQIATPNFAAQPNNQYVLTVKVTDDGAPTLYRLAEVTINQVTTDSGLQVHLTYDDADSDSDGYTTDEAGPNLQNGLLVGGPVFADDSFGQWSISLNGATQDVELAGYKGITGTQSRTVATWIKTTRDGAVAHWGQASTGTRWTIRIGAAQSDGLTDGLLRLETGGGLIVGSTDLRDDEWHHIAVVFDNDGTPDVSDVRLYVDGVEETYTQVTAQAFNTVAGVDVRIGHSHYGTRFKGLMDDFRLYDRAISQGEIIELVQQSGLDTGIETTVMSTTAGQAAVGTLTPTSPDPDATFTFAITAGDTYDLFEHRQRGQPHHQRHRHLRLRRHLQDYRPGHRSRRGQRPDRHQYPAQRTGRRAGGPLAVQ